MSKKDDALKLAREALEHISSHYMSLPKIGCMALAAVEEAIAEQPAQSLPWHHPDCEGECIACLIEREVTAAYGTQGLAYLRRHIAVTQPPEDALRHRIAELEGALAGLQTQRKPLSGYINRAGINANDSPITVVEKLERVIEATHQETQRIWQGLTDEEVLDMARTFGAQPWPPGSCVALGQMVEAKLREKNNG